jgi:hypothetical protein
MELNTKQKGNATEINCLAAFVSRGINVSIPYGDSARYDFIIDVNNKLYKIQCKTAGAVSEGVYSFPCRSCKTRASGNSRRSYTKDEIDFFCTYIDQKCYLVPISETAARSKTLRFIPTNNGQEQHITYAESYELDIQLQKLM